MRSPRKYLHAAALAALIGGILLRGTGQARADDAQYTGLSFGPRAAYFRGEDADSGNWFGGAQLRLHFTEALAIEGSVDYRRNYYGDTRLDTFPVQASLLGYLLPGKIVSPYVLGGAGWYYTHVQGPNGYDDTQNRLGWHIGGGLEVFLNRTWSVDADYRHIWISDVNSQNDNAVDTKYDDDGYEITSALNYHF